MSSLGCKQQLVTCNHKWIGYILGFFLEYEIIVKYSNPHLISSSPNYYWFMQYMKNDNGENGITQLPLGMNFSYTWGKLI